VLARTGEERVNPLMLAHDAPTPRRIVEHDASAAELQGP
jgi:hypothetical protein